MCNLLIIEHEDIARDTLGSFSEKLGYKPILIFDPAVCNAVKSVGQICSTKKPCADILLIDNDSPGFDGLNLVELQTAKGCKVTPQRKALMARRLTEKVYEKASSLGCHVIQKPVTYKNLESWLNGLEGIVV